MNANFFTLGLLSALVSETTNEIPRKARPPFSIEDLAQATEKSRIKMSSAIKAALKEFIKTLEHECRLDLGRIAYEELIASGKVPSGMVTKPEKPTEEYHNARRRALVERANFLFGVLGENSEFSQTGPLPLDCNYLMLLEEISTALSHLKSKANSDDNVEDKEKQD